jgi:hypothetical protein
MKFTWEASDIIAGRLMVDTGGESHIICWRVDERGTLLAHASLIDGMIIELNIPVGDDGYYPDRPVQDELFAAELTKNGYIPAEMWSGPSFVDAVAGRRGKQGSRFKPLRKRE